MIKMIFLVKIFFEPIIENIILDIVNEDFIYFGLSNHPPWHKWIYDKRTKEIKSDK